MLGVLIACYFFDIEVKTCLDSCEKAKRILPYRKRLLLFEEFYGHFLVASDKTG